MDDKERREILSALLDQTFGAGYTKKEQLLNLADQLRVVMDGANAMELKFIHGLLDGAIAHVEDRYSKIK